MDIEMELEDADEVTDLNLNLDFLQKYNPDEDAPTPHNTKSNTTKHIASQFTNLSISTPMVNGTLNTAQAQLHQLPAAH